MEKSKELHRCLRLCRVRSVCLHCKSNHGQVRWRKGLWPSVFVMALLWLTSNREECTNKRTVIFTLGSSGWVEWLHSPRKGWRDSLPPDAQWQLHQSHGGRWQRRLRHESEAISKDCCTERELSQGHPAIPDRAHHPQVSSAVSHTALH